MPGSSRYGYDSDEDLQFRYRRRQASSPPPPAVRYVRPPPREYYGRHLETIEVGRNRSRSRERRSPPVVQQAPAPPIHIHNSIHNELPEEEYQRRMQLAPRRGRRYSSTSSSSRSRSRSRARSRSSAFMTREEWEAEQARINLDKMLITGEREKEEQRLIKNLKEEAELQRAKGELDQIKDREARAEEEKRIIKAIELKRLREEDEAEEERKRREKEAADAVAAYKKEELEKAAKAQKARDEKERAAKEAVEKWQKEELERIARERKEQEERDAEYKRRLEEDLYKSGLDSDAIAAILKKEKIKKEAPAPAPAGPALGHPGPPLHHMSGHPMLHQQPAHPQHAHGMPPQQMVAPPHMVAPQMAPDHGAIALARPTYTRMARKHLSVETLRTYEVEFELDHDPDFVLIKRWVPEWEQDQFWKHTKYIRERRRHGGGGRVLLIEEKKHHSRSRSREPEFEWVRKKNDRRRSKSPNLLMYLAGVRPA